MRFLALAQLGPISGPLAAGMMRNWRLGDRLAAGLYLLALIATPFALAAILDGLVP